MKLADSHLHLFSDGYRGLYGRSLLRPDVEVYEQLRAIHGIERGLVVGYQGEGIDTDNNIYVRSLAAKRSWMATVAHIDARTIPSAQAVSSLLADGHVGVALYVEESRSAKTTASWPAAVWHVLNERRAIISLNVSLDFISVFASIVRENPDCVFLVSHMGMPGSYKTAPAPSKVTERLAALLRLATMHNILVKISGLYAFSDPTYDYPHHAAAPFVQAILERFGPERCLWGSDFSPALDHVSFAQTVSNPWLDGLGESERANVMGKNLIALLEQVRRQA